MSKDIDETTRKEVFKIVKEGNRDGVWVWQIVASVNSKFSLYTKKKWRIEAIVRSEITRASNKSQDEAYVQSRIVQYKEWYTAVDERVCPYCNDLNKKKIWLWKDFFKEGDTHLGEKITYENISYPPRHVNCRCTIRPIIKRKSAEALETKLKNKGFTLNTNAIENGE
jgi:SPP1 gp7 family putative phage head morphogenesis protein